MSFFRFNLKNDIRNGLVGEWKFDEGTGTSAFDTSGNNKNIGTLTGSPTYGIGKKGTCLTLNGSSTYIAFSSSTLTSLDNHDKTIMLWIKPTSLAQAGLVDKDFDSGAPNYGGWGLWMQSTGQLWWWAESSLDLKDNGSHSVSAGIWNHVAVTWSNSTQTANFYINGALNSTLTNASIVEKASGSAVFTIGALRNTSNVFSGGVDEVRVYNRVLSSSEITTVYRTY